MTAPATERETNTARGMMFMLLNGVAVYSQLTLIRMIADEVHPFEIAFFRSVFGLAVLLPVFLRSGIAPLRTRRHGLHAARGAFNACSLMLGFMALSLIPMAKFTALGFSSQLFATVLAILVIGETVRARRVTCLLIGFAGTLVVLQPGVEAIEPGSLLVLASALSWAVVLTIVKALSRTESSLTITLWGSIFMIPFSFLAALPYWTWPDLPALGWLFIIGALGSVVQLALSQAFREADATAVLPLDYLKLMWAAVIGYLFWAEVPPTATWIGGTMIFGAVTYLAVRERQVERAGRAAARAPKPP